MRTRQPFFALRAPFLVPAPVWAPALAAMLAAAAVGCGGSHASTSKTSGGSSTSSTTGAGGGGGGATTSTTASTTGSGGSGGAGATTGAGGEGGGTGGAGGSCVPAPETCNGIDDDCNGQVDDGDPGGGADCMTGLKGICAVGHEHCIQGVVSCVPDHGPGEVAETCNGLDDDCNGLIDEGLPTQAYYKDDDGDGFGTQATIQACSQPDGYAAKSGDCNDNNANIYPGAIELCNDADDNCNGFVDEGVQKPTFYKDNDGDGVGGVTSILACSAPMGYVADAGDCNDFNASIHPGAQESCNEADDDCNGIVDDGLPQSDVYTDLDGDGHGGKNALPKQHCLINGTDPPFGYSLTHDDCDDSKSTVYPKAPELCDGVLNDCTLQVADYQCPTKCPGSWPVAIGGGAGYVSVAQLDSDAELEIVAEQVGSTVVLEHDGTQKWKAAGANYSYPSLGDVDHDDVLDVAATVAGTVRLIKGSDGTVLQTLASPNAGSWYGASILDVDGDGWADVAPQGGPGIDLLKLGAGGVLLSKTTYSALPGQSGFSLAPILFADLDGDKVPELLAGSANFTCSGNLPSCMGRFYAFESGGAYYNDPTWTDPNKPWFQVAGYPSEFAGEGRWGSTLDLDGDGVLEVGQEFNTGGQVWTFDGDAVAGATFKQRMAPVNADGTLTSGALKPVSGAIVDLEGDGKYEQVAIAGGGMSISKGGQLMDGYPINISGGAPTIADVNRDGALDILWIGSNNAVNCWTLKNGTYARSRVLYSDAIGSAGSPGIYPSYTYDPFEPNEPSGSPNPATSTNPPADFRAFQPWGLRDQYNVGSGWSHALRGLIGHGGDVDYYWFVNSYSSIGVVSDVAAKLHLDLDVFVFVPNGNAWQYACEAHVADTTSGSLYFHPIQATGTCPAGMNGNKGFLVRVKGHDAGTDFGPWPYDLTWVRG